MNRILVLGSSGQIGGHLVKHLRSQDYEVITFDIFSDPGEDLRIQGILDDLLPQMDFVFFLAFDVGGSRYLNKYQKTFQFLDNNVKLMAYTFESLNKYNSKFIFASSQMSNMDYSSYGITKRLGEVYTEVLGGVVAKFWNVYGFEPDENKFHVITDLIYKAATTGKIDLITDGQELRQLLYADDCCDCLTTLMRCYDHIDRSKPLHVSSMKWSKIIDVANLIAEKMGIYEVNPANSIDTVQQDKRNEPDPYIQNFWIPKTTLSEGIDKVIFLMKEAAVIGC